MSPQQSIAHYRITSKLGEGGMGTVYRATDTKLNREVAVKVLPESFACDPDRLGRFAREAQVLAQLNHSNIAAIYGVEQNALVLELVEGKEPQGPIATDDALNLAYQLIDALEYAHDKGIVHRDLKPANLKLTEEGRLKVLDFGLAKAVETTTPAKALVDSPTMTFAASMPGVILGTAGYMSPEQARGNKVDHRTDIWAFGAVLFELLTGQRAFTGDTVSDTIANVLKTDPDFSLVPERFRPLVRRCLIRDPKQRLGWIGDARLLLETPATPAQTGRRPLLIASVAVLAAAAGFLLSRFLPSGSSPTPMSGGKITRITTGSNAYRPAVTADGKLVAYFSRRPERQTWDLWVQQVGGPAAIRLTDDPHLFTAYPPVFSADGSKIYYVSKREPPGAYEVPVFGGEPRLVVASARVSPLVPSPDGKWLSYSNTEKLFIRPANGGDERDITPGIPKESSIWPMVWSSDSTKLMASIVTETNREGFILSPEGTVIREKFSFFGGNLMRRGFGNLNMLRIQAWLPNDDLIFNARFGDATNLFRVPLAKMGELEPQPVTTGPWNNGDAAINGTHLVFANTRLAHQVRRLPADLDSGKITGELEPVTDDLVEAQFPDVRADGSAIAYISLRQGGQGAYLLDLKTRKERKLYLGDRAAAYATFSPDGSSVAFGQGGAGWPVFVVATEGGDARSIGNAYGRIRGWTRDGKYLLIWRVPPGKPESIGLLEVATGKAIDIISDNQSLTVPRLSPDNRWIVFNTGIRNRARLWVAPFRGSAVIAKSEWIPIGEGSNPVWSPDSHTLYFGRYPEGSSDASTVMRQPLDAGSGHPSGAATEFYRFPGNFDMFLLNTAVATRTHLYTLADAGSSDIWMMELSK